MKQTLNFCSVIIFLSILSCANSQNSEELLTQKEWILYGRYDQIENDNNSDDLKLYFKKQDKVLAIKFQNDGTANIVDGMRGEQVVFKWRYSSANKDKIILQSEVNETEFQMLELTTTDLKLGEYLAQPNHLRLEHYKHIDDPDWSDGSIDKMNDKALKNFTPNPN